MVLEVPKAQRGSASEVAVSLMGDIRRYFALFSVARGFNEGALREARFHEHILIWR